MHVAIRDDDLVEEQRLKSEQIDNLIWSVSPYMGDN